MVHDAAGMHVAERTQQKDRAQRNPDRDQYQSRAGRAAANRQAQAQSDHTRPPRYRRVAPSRTNTSRAAYAAMRGS